MLCDLVTERVHKYSFIIKVIVSTILLSLHIVWDLFPTSIYETS